MFKIRKSQMEALTQQYDLCLASELAVQLRTRHLDLVTSMDEQALVRSVYEGLLRGRGYGITKKYPLSMFVELMFIIGPLFDCAPKVQFWLCNKTIAPNARIEYLIRSLTESDWQDIRRSAL